MGVFEGQVVAITGAGRGIGREAALLMAREGAKVVVNDLGGGPQGGGGDTSFAQAVVNEIKVAGGEAVAETSSIASMAGGKALIECTMDTYGRLDFLINNAGIIRPRKITEMSEEDFDLVLNVSLKGYFATIRAGAEHLAKQGGAIVNMGSPSGFGHWGMANYCASKEGVVGMTRAVARELGEYGVRANVVRPMSGGTNLGIPEVMETIAYQTQTLHIPPISNNWLLSHGVDSQPQHVASVIAWLCAPHSANLSGREVYIVGGHVALVQEPELIRSQFAPEGWTFEGLCDPMVTAALTYDVRNRYTGK
ncbi:SDR family NAD(P)-dependent oxidoreductase [Novosphingobium taihuense]|uniref:NAD(P)-dependent dehydrogenase (Short-subunit alcohol dehydrogenase family) n=1 Tax=Novosphingobium taihuense TaxID=260085 RepID=A0A7W7EVF9_9SPHN|nr:SDR family NAD(P)-dependent oxidoreductase [Novosphingobium taihuense]MBB4615422.1 NAD(P)-dependent dehydrogenase (short-subunit alcohol dehydrogenase family) [Novosphingobium taihuense]TWH82130.1 NAD(P)-dependent dehydrogenase (short-subunit alcohol dehydrogenase family) [Novosphingobium taihuense]